jgi:hypothetical protein
MLFFILNSVETEFVSPDGCFLINQNEIKLIEPFCSKLSFFNIYAENAVFNELSCQLIDNNILVFYQINYNSLGSKQINCGQVINYDITLVGINNSNSCFSAQSNIGIKIPFSMYTLYEEPPWNTHTRILLPIYDNNLIIYKIPGDDKPKYYAINQFTDFINNLKPDCPSSYPVNITKTFNVLNTFEIGFNTNIINGFKLDYVDYSFETPCNINAIYTPYSLPYTTDGLNIYYTDFCYNKQDNINFV